MVGRRAAAILLTFWFVVGSTLLLAATTARGQQEALPFAGYPAPDLTLELLDGGTFTLSANRGKVVLVNFWATWCPPCREEMPELERLHREEAGRVLVVGVDAMEDPETVRRFIEAEGYTYPVALDPKGEALAAYLTRAIPTSFFVTPDGFISRRHTGILTLQAARRFVEEALAYRPPER
ncbi:TlpA family protein disulfide reductase [Limnochorda pilosa]|uniref:Alkyl hydroperoxide reductase n=1 Tax=Limnochorda pilosa TaxID=1555112 RepID=A0A0K2SJT3_LIMPI|nr:TlpA disulfide reductase family protein [Limnochorda pilosa]BAS27267.1 alkyl hydroperoxide reductase [Limnochorda pilosa]